MLLYCNGQIKALNTNKQVTQDKLLKQEKERRKREKNSWVDTVHLQYIILLSLPFIIPKHDDFLLNGKSSLNVVQINCINWKNKYMHFKY